MPPSAWGNANSNNNNPTQPTPQQQQQHHHRQMNSSTSSTIDTVNSNGGTGGGPKGNASSSNPTPNAWNNTATAAQNHRGGGHQQANVHHPSNNNNNNNMVNSNGAGGGAVGQQQQQPQNAGNNGANGGGTAKNPQLEQLNTMREALFAQDGWGCEHVNQDTNWEVPGSPEPTAPAAGGASAGGGALAGAGANPMAGSAVNTPKTSDGRSAPNGGGGGVGGGWKVSNMNTGTELWESNLRNGAGAGPHNHHHHGLHHQQPKVATAPWVPTNNLGGTWMEDDDNGGPAGTVAVPDPSASAGWNGSGAVGSTIPGAGLVNAAVTSASAWAGSNGAGGWQAAGGPVGGQQPQQTPATISGGLKKDLNEWNAVGGATAAAAGMMLGAGGPNAGGVVPGPSNVSGWNDGRTGVGGFNLATSVGPSGNVITPSTGTGGLGGGELRGDPRGISGRLNGAMDSTASSIVGGMWGGTEHVPGGNMLANKLGGGSALVVNNPGQQWGAGTGTGANGAGSKLAPSGWDDVVNGGRPVSLDEHGGTATMGWGQGAGSNSIALARQNSTGGWKDPMGRPGQQVGIAGGAGAPFARPIGGGPLAIGKAPDAMWGGAAAGGPGGGGGQNTPGIVRNGSWEEASNSNWGVGGETGDKSAAGAGTPWNVELGAPGWNKPLATAGKVGGSVGWPDPGSSDLATAGTMDWCLGGGVKHGAGGSNPLVGKQQPSLHNPLEFVRSSKEYRMLCEMGHKKEEVEFALRAANMNIDEAMDLLRHGVAGGGGWRGAGAGVGGRSLIDDHHGAGFDGGPFAGGPPRIPPLNHAGGGLSYSQNNQAMLNNIAIGPGASLGSLDGATGGPANLVALNSFKYLSQGSAGGGLTGQHHPSFNQVGVVGVGGRGQQQQQQQHHHHHQHQQQQQLAAAAAAQPSNQQLRMLVQQIQLAVQSGFLNHQILNQPLAPQTLILLNQLLNHIKQMQMTQSNLARSGTTGGVSAVQLTLAINKHKSQIAQLQQQIAAQQSIYLKQQQQQQQQGQPGQPGPIPPPSLLPAAAGMGAAGGGPPGGMDFLRQQHDLMALQSNFGELALGKDALLTTAGTASVFTASVVPVSLALAGHAGAGVSGAGNAGSNGNSSSSSSSTSQQSRLNQWKLPSLEKDPSAGKDDLTDFSRAPGPGSLAKSAITTPATTGSGNLDILGLVQDGWPAGLEQPRRTNLVADGWPEQADESDGKDWTTGNGGTPPPDNSAFSDLVPEFEPGKPWKGTQMKIEDDPSITPGSVARSPLSIATAAKDSELFAAASADSKAGGISPSSSSVALTDAGTISGGGLDLTSSAWSFSTAGTSPSTVVSTVIGAGTDVWSAPIGKLSAATRGPPPGLGGANGSKHVGSTGGVASRISASATWGNASGGTGTAGSWGATGTSWLLLRNLTSQIDASTLRTLCMQHGPILSFHPYPAHGLALCRYSSRDEAMKAQQALNNCPLGASTISAECPASEAEVQTYLQQLGGGTAITATVSSAGTASISSISSQSWRLRNPTAATGGTDTWGSGWPIGRDAGDGSGSTNTSNLWAPLDGGDRETPSSLNSFLPESLLGSELN
uniref:UBA domain-containing protein n=1 Tax=Anopheles triannulatus TaxID=58253 RepID=A0A2M4A5U9_9DIPT